MKTKFFQLPHQVIGSPNMVKNFFNKLNILLELRSQNDIELHVKKVEKRGTGLEKKQWLQISRF